MLSISGMLLLKIMSPVTIWKNNMLPDLVPVGVSDRVSVGVSDRVSVWVSDWVSVCFEVSRFEQKSLA